MKEHSASCCDTRLCVRGQPPRTCIFRLLHNQLFFKADDNAKFTASFSERCLIGTISYYSGLVNCAAGFNSAVESRKKCGESYWWAKKSQTGHTLRTFITAGENHRHFVIVSSKWFSNANTVSNISLLLWVISFLNPHSFIFVKKWNMVQKVFVNSYHD